MVTSLCSSPSRLSRYEQRANCSLACPFLLFLFFSRSWTLRWIVDVLKKGSPSTRSTTKLATCSPRRFLALSINCYVWRYGVIPSRECAFYQLTTHSDGMASWLPFVADHLDQRLCRSVSARPKRTSELDDVSTRLCISSQAAQIPVCSKGLLRWYVEGVPLRQ